MWNTCWSFLRVEGVTGDRHTALGEGPGVGSWGG